MAGFVAILADSRGARTDAADLDALVGCYRSLRPASEQVRVVAGELGRAALLGSAGGANIGVERDNGSWAIQVGRAHPSHGTALQADPAELDGQFGLIRYLHGNRAAELLTDPFGMQSVYRAHRDGVAYVSTSALALAKHLRAPPSRLGLELFLRSGPQFTELTSWEGISRVPPATRLCFDGDGAGRAEVYWRPAVDPAIARLNFERAATHCVAAAVDVLGRQYASLQRSWCDITGGYDTRLLALLLHEAGIEFTTNTVGEEDSTDVVLGQRVARTGGWQWVRGDAYEFSPEAWRERVLEAVAWGDGQMEALQLASVIAGHRNRSTSATTLFAGGGGGVWRDYAWQQEGPLGGRSKRVSFERWVATRFLHAADVSVFSSDPTPRAREALIEQCRAYAAPYASELNSAQLDMLLAYKCVGHDGAYQSAVRGVLAVELPYFAKRIFDAPFSVQPRLRNFHRLMRQAISRLDPRVAALPTTSGGPAEPLRWRNVVRFSPYVTHRAQGAARKLTQHLPGPTLGAVSEPTDAKQIELRRLLLSDLVSRTDLDPLRMRSGCLYDRDRLRALANSPSAVMSGWPLLGRILTAEMALEVVDACLD